MLIVCPSVVFVAQLALDIAGPDGFVQLDGSLFVLH